MIDDRHDDLEFMDEFVSGRIKKAFDKLIHGDIDALEKGIIDADEDDLVYRYLNDIKDRGETSHFYELDEAFKWKRGLVYTYTGYAGTGKSEFNLFLAFLKAKFDDWRFIVFVPESMSSNEEGYMTVEEVYDTLAHIYWGKPVDISDSNCQTEAEYREAIRWIKAHFTIMYPNGGFANQKQLIEQAAYIVKTRGKHDAVIVDPWNNVVSMQDKNELLDDYLRRMIMEAKLFAVNSRMAWVYVTHPSKPTPLKDGSLSPIDMYNIRGGMSFGNGSDFVIVIERPFYFMGEVDDPILGLISGRNHPLVHYVVKKVKNQKLLKCRPNTIETYFNKRTNRYENQYQISPLDEAYKKNMGKLTSVSQVKFPAVKTDGMIQLSIEPSRDIHAETARLLGEKEDDDTGFDDMPF